MLKFALRWMLNLIFLKVSMCMKNGSIVTIIVEIHWIPQRCMSCQTFGHSKKYCPTKPAK
ncbi:hypothetical protein REPUB_Repub03eG0137800 [Reevesia pubescens]